VGATSRLGFDSCVRIQLVLKFGTLEFRGPAWRILEKAKPPNDYCADTGKDLTHPQRVLLFKDSSVWRHPQSQYFIACFRDHNGRQRWITTKETNRKKAQMLADEYEKASRTKRTLQQAQEVLDK
jgi:Phage integrase, N-terminal SAM-like domain